MTKTLGSLSAHTCKNIPSNMQGLTALPPFSPPHTFGNTDRGLLLTVDKLAVRPSRCPLAKIALTRIEPKIVQVELLTAHNLSTCKKYKICRERVCVSQQNDGAAVTVPTEKLNTHSADKCEWTCGQLSRHFVNRRQHCTHFPLMNSPTVLPRCVRYTIFYTTLIGGVKPLDSFVSHPHKKSCD